MAFQNLNAIAFSTKFNLTQFANHFAFPNARKHNKRIKWKTSRRSRTSSSWPKAECKLTSAALLDEYEEESRRHKEGRSRNDSVFSEDVS